MCRKPLLSSVTLTGQKFSMKMTVTLKQVHPNLRHFRNYHKLESPPAWTQEAYCPPCSSEYSFCCPIFADPPPPGWTWPPRQLDLTPPAGPDPPASWTWPPLAGPDPPCQLDLNPPPQLDLTPPCQLDLTSPAGSDPPTSWTWPPRQLDLTPPQLDLTPPPPAGPDPHPPGVDWQTKWNYYLPVVLRTRAVKSDDLFSSWKTFCTYCRT